jgi:hypothetical protein
VIAESSSFPDNPCLDWVCPALLILDVMSQPVLFDKENLTDSIRELSLHEENNKNLVTHTPILTSEIKSFLHHRFGFTKKNFNDDSDGVFDDTTCPSQVLPLEIENGLTSESAQRALNVSVQLLKTLKSDSKRATGVYQAIMQLIVHLTRVPDLRVQLLEHITLHEVFQYCSQFDGSAFFLFSLILHITEDPESLAKSMESVMRFCVQRISKTESSKSLKRLDSSLPTAITLESFLATLTPLLYRNEQIFMSVFRTHMRVIEFGRVLMVGLKDSSQEPGPELGNRAEGYVQGIVDEILMLIMLQWIRLCSLQREEIFVGSNRKTDVPPPIESSSKLNLSISDLLILLADLITSVPGLATCIHKFQLSSALERFGSESQSCLKYCLGDMKHVVTGEPLHSTSFLTFLVHYLLVSQFTMPNTSTPPTPDPLNVLDQSESESAPVISVEESEKKKKETIASIVGKSIADSPAYLVAALLARPGDGRRRTMKELFNALKLHDHALDTTEKLKAISILATTIQKYQIVNPAWRRSEMLVVPTKDLLDMMSSQRAFQLLSDVLCAIRLDHPLAQQISLDLAVPLEILIRKGFPATQSVPPQRRRSTLTDTSLSQNITSDEFPGPIIADQSPVLLTEPVPLQPTDHSQLNDLPIEASISEYIPQADDHEFGDSVVYHSDEGEEEEEVEEEEEEEDDDEDDDEEEEDDDDEVDEDDDEDDQHPNVSYYVDEAADGMSSDGEENNQNMDVVDHDYPQVPVQDVINHHEGEEDDHEEDDEDDEDEDDDAHQEDLVDQFFSILTNGANHAGDAPDNDEEDDLDNPDEGNADVEQEIFLNGDLENPEIDSELRRMANSPVEDDDEGEDDDPVGGLDSGFLVNHLEDDDDVQIE